MPAIIGLVLLAVLVAIVAVALLSAAAHLLFSPLILVVIAIVAWVKLRPRRSHQ